MRLYWMITILAVWLSIGAGFVLGASWCAYWRQERQEKEQGIEI